MMSLTEQLRMLHVDGYFDSEETLRDLTSGKAEFEYMAGFAADVDLSVKVCREQLRSLWTAYCLHRNLVCDTSSYDSDLRKLWQAVESNATRTWVDFDRLDRYMCSHLV